MQGYNAEQQLKAFQIGSHLVPWHALDGFSWLQYVPVLIISCLFF
jgi:hypothetical protein